MSSFNNFRKELIEAVGAENVIDDPETIDSYSKDYSSATPRKPLLVVKPSSVEQVSKTVKVSNKYLIPVVPRSSGAGFYGGAVPSEGGIVIDMSGMNKILDIDEKNRLVRFEPGVTWGQLQEALAKHNLMALNPLLPHPRKSALTSHLERDRSLIPKQEYKEPLYAVEFVSPTGETHKTGPAAIPQTKNKNHTPHGPRPVTVNWRRILQGAQGTLGIVTWGVAKTEYLPRVQKLYFIPFQDIEAVAEAAYKILRRVIGNECFILNDFNLALIATSLGGKSHEYLENVRKNAPPYTMILCSAGGRRWPEERIAYEEEALMEIGLDQGFEPLTGIKGVAGLDKLFASTMRKPWPQNRTYWKFNYKGLSKDIFFVTTLDRMEKYTSLLYQTADRFRYPVRDIGVYVQPLEQGRACYVEYGLHFNPDTTDDAELVNSMWREACETLISNGAFFSRPYGELAPMVYGRCAAYYTALRRLKEACDPNRVMNPGKLCL